MPCGRGGVCVILLDGFICAHEGGSDSSMAQSILPENSTLARQIRTAAGHGALSHAVILSGEGDRAAAARYLAAAYVCRESERPCLRCAACRKVLEDIHPDVRWIADTERRELPVETLRELRRDVYIRPNEGERKVYIFSDCGQLNERDQNVLLKIVEEGPPYAAFLFCTETSAALLETIRSRCVEWKLRGSGEVALSGRALELCRMQQIDGVVYFCQWGCKQTMGMALLARQMLADAGLPTLVLDGDGCDSRNVADGQMVTRVGAFLEQLEGLSS